MNKARKRFVLYAILGVFLLMTALLGVINAVNYTMAGEDADHLTEMISQTKGVLQAGKHSQDRAQRTGPFEGAQMMGPDSPEMQNSLRYFTFAFNDETGEAETKAFAVSSVSEAEAESWARSLTGERDTGWTETVYRYRVWHTAKKTWVTVIDQSRELTGFYRILYISLAGLGIGTLLSAAALAWLGRRLFQPLEDADRKQKRFIAGAEKECKVPLTVISADVENWERKNGESEETLSIHRQVKRMTGIMRALGRAGTRDGGDGLKTGLDLAALAREAADEAAEAYRQKGCTLEVDAPGPVRLEGDSEDMMQVLEELLENGRKFASGGVRLRIREEGGHAVIETVNATTLPDGAWDQAMDRFTRLENADGEPGVGLGLARVKEIVQERNGRVSAKVENGQFILRIQL